MITEYIELTWAKNTTRHLFPIDSLQSIGEATKEKTTTENGIETTNTICLEPEVYAELLRYVSEKLVAPSNEFEMFREKEVHASNERELLPLRRSEKFWWEVSFESS